MPASNFRQFSKPLNQEDCFSPALLTGSGGSSHHGTYGVKPTSAVSASGITSVGNPSTGRHLQHPPQEQRRRNKPRPFTGNTPMSRSHVQADPKQWPSGDPVSPLCNLPNEHDSYMSQMDVVRLDKSLPLQHSTTFTPRLTPPPNSAKTMRYTLDVSGAETQDYCPASESSTTNSSSRLLCNRSALHDRLITTGRRFSKSRFAVQSEEGSSCGQINWVLSPCSKLTIDKKGTSCQQGPFSREFSVTCAAPNNWLRMKWGKSHRCSSSQGYTTAPGDVTSLTPTPDCSRTRLRDTPYRC